MRLSERIAKLELAAGPGQMTRAQLDASAAALLAKLEDLASTKPAPPFEETPESRTELLRMLMERCR
jgi:hypothetical protein